MNHKFIKNDEMENIAESVLQKANINTMWKGRVERIDIDALIEFEYDLDIVWENIDCLSQNGIVLAAINPKRKIIYMNETQKDLFIKKMGTMNFSKAHELGHWILHVTKQNEYEQLSFMKSETYFCRGDSKRRPEEIQADMFAASILMPKNIITGVINQLKEDGQITFPNLYKLADDFEVSISALTTRMSKMGLLYIVDKDIHFNKAEVTGQSLLF